MSLLGLAGLGFVTVVDGETVPNRITPDLTPAAYVFEQLDHTETWISGGRIGTGGSKKDVWNLEIHLWGHYPDADSSAAPFRALVEGVKEVFRANQALGHLGDTATTRVLQAQGRIRSHIDPWQQGQGLVVRHALVAVEVQEIIEGV